MPADDLTVFIIACGEESFDDCRAALDAQTLRDVPIDIIRDVYPMSEAFNEMHRRATTPYFVQVDADMILHPHALETLLDGARRMGPLRYAAFGELYEEGFGVGGSIRCWKASFFRCFHFRDRRTVDRDLIKRSKWFGFRRYPLKQVLGIHRPRHSRFSEYLKTKSDVEKWRYLRRPPERYALPLLSELLNAPHENRYRLLGLLLGALTGWERVQRSKDLSVESARIQSIVPMLAYEHLDALALHTDPEPSALCHSFAQAYRREPRGRDALLADMLRLFTSDADAVDRAAILQEASR